jgi:hypothetical protein
MSEVVAQALLSRTQLMVLSGLCVPCDHGDPDGCVCVVWCGRVVCRAVAGRVDLGGLDSQAAGR